jgi:hypothetical protein
LQIGWALTLLYAPCPSPGHYKTYISCGLMGSVGNMDKLVYTEVKLQSGQKVFVSLLDSARLFSRHPHHHLDFQSRVIGRRIVSCRSMPLESPGNC